VRVPDGLLSGSAIVRHVGIWRLRGGPQRGVGRGVMGALPCPTATVTAELCQYLILTAIYQRCRCAYPVRRCSVVHGTGHGLTLICSDGTSPRLELLRLDEDMPHASRQRCVGLLQGPAWVTAPGGSCA